MTHSSFVVILNSVSTVVSNQLTETSWVFATNSLRSSSPLLPGAYFYARRWSARQVSTSSHHHTAVTGAIPVVFLHKALLLSRAFSSWLVAYSWLWNRCQDQLLSMAWCLKRQQVHCSPCCWDCCYSEDTIRTNQGWFLFWLGSLMPQCYKQSCNLSCNRAPILFLYHLIVRFVGSCPDFSVHYRVNTLS